MKIALHQTAGTPRDPEANIRHLEVTAAEAAHRGAELLVLPEMWLTGYNIGPAVRDLAQPSDGPAAERIAGIARKHGLAILYGYPERADEGIFNAAGLVGRDGTWLANMRKAHLFGEEERRWFVPGNSGLPVVGCGRLRVGILICYDVEFPEAVRSLVLRGADLILVPTALFEPYSFVTTHVVPVRAWENHTFVAYANRCGREGSVTYVGGSRICAPDGSALVGAEADAALLIAEIDPDAFLQRSAVDNPYLRDRRPELYGALTERCGPRNRVNSGAPRDPE